MKNHKLAILVVTAGLVTLTTGCASITGGTTQSVSVKTQRDSVDVAGANCVLTNARGTYTVTTPGTVVVHRAKDDLNVKCTKEGEPDALMTVQSSIRKGAIAGDIAWLGVLSVVSYGVDRANGSIYAYPQDIAVSFSSTVAPTPDAAKVNASPATSVELSAGNTPRTADTLAQPMLAK